MTDELKGQRVVTMMSPSEVKAIDDWMFENRVRSRGEAIRRLCQVGILAANHVPNIYQKTDKLFVDHDQRLNDWAEWALKEPDEVDMEEYTRRLTEALIGTTDQIEQLIYSLHELLDPIEKLKSTRPLRRSISDAARMGIWAKRVLEDIKKRQEAENASNDAETDT